MINQTKNDKKLQLASITADTFKGLQEELSKMINDVFEELSTNVYQEWFNDFMEKQRGTLNVHEYLRDMSNLSEQEYHNIKILKDLPEYVEKLSVEQKVPNGSWRINERMNYNIKMLNQFYNLVVQKKENDLLVVIQSITPCAIYVNMPLFD